MALSRASAGGLDAPLADYLGPRTARAIESGLGLASARDLLLHLPRRYLRQGELTALSDLTEGDVVTVMARVDKVDARRMRQRRGSIVEVTVSDKRNELKLTFFNQAWRAKDLRPGRIGLFAGKVSAFKSRFQLAHPTYLLLPEGGSSDGSDDVEAAAAFAGALIPVYPATSSLPSWRVSGAIRVVLDQIDWSNVRDPIDDVTRRRFGLLGVAEAFRAAHRPADAADHERALERFRWDEALAVQLSLAGRREWLRHEPSEARPPRPDGLVAALDNQLPFELTTGQREVGSTIAADLACTSPMQRLLQGEVGSGKTVVALRAMLQVVENGGQAALLAPTEVLAGQHLRSLRALLGTLGDRGLLGGNDHGTRVVMITGSMSASARRHALAEIASGQAGIVVGTHALLEEAVKFGDLGLVVVDEQHRFGVQQRAALVAKAPGGLRPHLLVMTATPIPRTVAMTVFGDLEVSTLAEVPATRSGYATHVVAAIEHPAHLARVWERVREEVEAGRQAYVVCPKIDSGREEDLAEAVDWLGGDPEESSSHPPVPTTVGELAPFLSSGPLAGLRIEVLHGRMAADEKEAVMRRLAAGPESDSRIEVLVSTTVIEVGVDVPNATVMVVVGAEHFGISQLHQLRGRVGRGEHRGLCLLLTTAEPGSRARARVESVAAQQDGFELARIDLAERREGDVLGAAQAGKRRSLRMLSLARDESIIVAAREVADAIVARDPHLVGHRQLAIELRRLLPREAEVWLERT